MIWVLYLCSNLKHFIMKKDMIFFDPLSDFGFKRIFASENNKDILINFLNACNEIFCNKTTYYFVELPKFAAVKDKGSEDSLMHKWLDVLTSIASSTDQDYGSAEKGVFQKLIEECKISKLSNMEKEEYEKSIFEYEDVQDAIACAREDGVEEGRLEGLCEGKRQLVRNMFTEGFDLETIARISGLKHEEILGMQQQ